MFGKYGSDVAISARKKSLATTTTTDGSSVPRRIPSDLLECEGDSEERGSIIPIELRWEGSLNGRTIQH